MKNILEILNIGYIDPTIWSWSSVREITLDLEVAIKNEISRIESSLICKLGLENLSCGITSLGEKIIG